MATRNKEEAFVRVVERRMTKILADIKRLGNLASNNYAYTTEDVNTIVDAIKDEASVVGDKLYAHVQGPGKKSSRPTEQFKLRQKTEESDGYQE